MRTRSLLPSISQWLRKGRADVALVQDRGKACRPYPAPCMLRLGPDGLRNRNITANHMCTLLSSQVTIKSTDSCGRARDVEQVSIHAISGESSGRRRLPLRPLRGLRRPLRPLRLPRTAARLSSSSSIDRLSSKSPSSSSLPSPAHAPAAQNLDSDTLAHVTSCRAAQSCPPCSFLSFPTLQV